LVIYNWFIKLSALKNLLITRKFKCPSWQTALVNFFEYVKPWQFEKNTIIFSASQQMFSLPALFCQDFNKSEKTFLDFATLNILEIWKMPE
jgi:hypothetical protein